MRYQSNLQQVAFVRYFSVLLLLILAWGSAGCANMQSLLGNITTPQASVKGVKLQGLSPQGVTLGFDVEILNPYALPLPLVGLDYNLATTDNTSLLAGAAKLDGTVPAKGSRTITLPAQVDFASLLKTANQIRPGSVVPYTANLKLSADAPGVGPISLPISKQGQLPIPAIPQVELAGLEWKTLTLQQASAIMSVKVRNTNQFPIDLSKMGYQLSLGGTQVVSAGVQSQAKLAPDAQHTLQIPFEVSPISLGLGAFNMLRDKNAGYQLNGAIQANTPFGPIDLPYTSAGKTNAK